MKKLILLSTFLTLTVHFGSFAQEVKPEEKKRESGHYDENKFRQMYDEMATPNMFRTASGAPGQTAQRPGPGARHRRSRRQHRGPLPRTPAVRQAGRPAGRRGARDRDEFPCDKTSERDGRRPAGA